jgi:cell division inhibitor SepF
MASAFKKLSLYLGLGQDDEYDDYEPQRGPARGAEPEAVAPVRPISSFPTNQGRAETVREPVRVERDREPEPAVSVRGRSASGTVRAVSGPSAKPHSVEPRSFADAQEVADTFKAGQPVIVNLQNVERDLARRIIDFSSGCCYALGGKMEKVANGVFLVTPANSDLDA